MDDDDIEYEVKREVREFMSILAFRHLFTTLQRPDLVAALEGKNERN